MSKAYAADEEAASDVLVLTKDNFDQSIKEHELIMVEFYAPWCGHCKALAPEYEKAATELKDTKAFLAKVDCTVESDICSSQGVQGYPTLKVFRDGHPSEFNKARKADAIVGYMQKQLLPALSDVTADNFDEFKSKDKVVVIGFFKDDSSDPFIHLKNVANKLRDDFLFGASTDEKLAKKQGVQVPGIVLYKKFDEGKNSFPENVEEALITKGDDAFSEEHITKFVKVNSVPLMNDIGPENYSKYIESGLPIGFLFFGNDEQKEKVGKQVEPIAKKFRGKVNFVYCDGNLYGGHAGNLNLKEEWPAFAIQEPVSGLKFPFDQANEITEDAVSSFVEEYVDGKLKPSIKSAPKPETNDEPVKVLVADTFNDIVKDKSKAVFVEFYAPWCGHCKRLAPIWDQLAEKLSSVESLVIAKMDATENDVPPGNNFQIEGFPTLKLFKAETNEVVDYNGDRSIDAFIEFLKKNAGKEFDYEEEPSKDEDEKKGSADHDEL